MSAKQCKYIAISTIIIMLCLLVPMYTVAYFMVKSKCLVVVCLLVE